MMKNLKILFLIFVLFLLFAVNSCGKRNPNTQPGNIEPTLWDDQPRGCSLLLVLENNNLAVEVVRGTTIHSDIRINFGSYNPDYRYDENKVEVDFGDGEGWIDVSEEVLEYLQTVEFDLLPSHVYETEGVYQARARVTFWDGEVYESRQFDITILPPEAGDGA